MPTKDQHKAFQKAIEANPTDPGPYLAFSDWLEEHGQEQEAERQRWLGKLAADPYNTALLCRFANWLLGQGYKQEADLRSWMVHLLKGKTDYDLVLTREGPVYQADSGEGGALSEELETEWRARAAGLFTQHPDAVLIVVGDGPPKDQGFRTRRPPGLGRSPVLYYNRASGKVYRVEGVPEVRFSSLCPFCGWDRVGYSKECAHFVTEMAEWPDNHAGTDGGAFGKVADQTLGPLAEAVSAFVESGGAESRGVDSLAPDRLRSLVEFTPNGSPEDAAFWEHIRQFTFPFGMPGQPWSPPGPGPHQDKAVFAEYVREVFWEAAPEGRINTNDRYDTGLLFLWSPAAAKTARKMARMVAEDVKRLRRETPRPRSKSQRP
jgi:uncharacterized protein (TIGR02996 family)